MTEKTVTTLDQLLPLLGGVETCKQMGAIIIAHVPVKLKFGLAQQARDTLGKGWTDRSVQHWLAPAPHTEARAKAQRGFCRASMVTWRAIPGNAEKGRVATKTLRTVPEVADRHRQASAIWKSNNLEHRIRYEFAKRQNNPAFTIASRLRSRLTCAVRRALQEGKFPRKPGNLEKRLGCTMQDFLAHIESQFTEGMSWANFHLIHLDHIRPLASFDLEDPAEVLKAEHYTNRAPLWAKDNLAKGDKWDGVAA